MQAFGKVVSTSAQPTSWKCYRAHLNPTARQIFRARTQALPDQGEDISEALRADLERLRAKSGASASTTSSRYPAQPANVPNEGGPLSDAKNALDKVLIADFFLVLFILAWLAAGVAQNALNGGSSPLLDAWYPLWPVLWQPALGVLMAGALVSGGIGWLAEQQSKKQ